MRFKNKSIVITGGGNGIGKETVKEFLQEGGNVVAVDLNTDALKQIEDEFADIKEGKLITFQGDISTQETNEAMIDLAVKEFGKIDILVNNAGVAGKCEPVAELENEDWDKMIKVDLYGPMYAIRHAVRVMLEQETGGNIVTIDSVAGLKGCRACVAYTVAKHGLVGLCEHTAFTYMHKGIRCNMVAPGSIKTHMSSDRNGESAFGRERIAAGMDPKIPVGKPSDIANAVLFLASDASSFINGETIVVDGGVSCN